MSAKTRRIIAGTTLLATALSPLALGLESATAFPKNHSVIGFDYIIDATTHVKRSNQTIVVKGGIFQGEVDFDTARIEGKIKLPDATVVTAVAGVGLVAIKTRTIPTKKVTGKVNLNNFKVTSTSHFLIKIVSMTPVYPAGVPSVVPRPNLVGNNCQTVRPVVVTMSGKANIGLPSTFKGTFTIPEIANCQGVEHALNQLMPGPGNTFTAYARPAP